MAKNLSTPDKHTHMWFSKLLQHNRKCTLKNSFRMSLIAVALHILFTGNKKPKPVLA